MAFHTLAHYSYILVIIGLVIEASSVRHEANITDSLLDASNEQSEMKVGCQCAEQGLCSSCALETCPFGDISSVTAFAGGGTAAVAGVAAWSVTTTSGQTYVVKFGGPMNKPLKAAQVAHALQVTTPRHLLVNKASCPKLWSQTKSFDSRWEQSLVETQEKMVSIQEHASRTKPEDPEPKEGSIQSSFWYHAGAIAALEWIIGKSDLFNDVPYDWKDDATHYPEVRDINLDNIFLDYKGLVAIDLDIDMSATRWGNWKDLLGEIVDGKKHFTWFNKVLFPMLSLKKSGQQEILRAGTDVFGPFKVEEMNGWDDEASPALTHLGFVDTLMHALEMEEYQQLPGLQHASNVDELMKHLDSLSKYYKQIIVPKQKQLLGKLYNCCKVKCTKKYLGMFRAPCTQKRPYHQVKLVQGKPFITGGIMGRIYAEYNGDPNEPDCDRASEFRPGEMKENYCECGKGAQGVRIEMTTIGDNYCSA